MPSGPLREVGAGGLSVYFIQTKSAIVIAKESLYSCGSPLKPSDYPIQKTDDKIEFEGVYFCPKCRDKNNHYFNVLSKDYRKFEKTLQQ
jgi:hypothetical protein